MWHQSIVRRARLLALALLIAVLASTSGPPAIHAQQRENLLTNPGFEPFVTPEGQYDYPLYRTDEGGGHIAEGWSPWWYNDEGAAYAAPEYDIAPISRDPFRVRSGEAAQQIFRPWVLWAAGVYQQVQVPANADLRFTIYGHAWASFCRPLARSACTRSSRWSGVSQRAEDPAAFRSTHSTSSTASATACR